MKISLEESSILIRALEIAEKRMSYGEVLESPEHVRDYIKLELCQLQHEVFGVIWLTAKHGVICHELLFNGTVDGSAVYAREVIKHALAHNAAACFIYHNHPSGIPEPSLADKQLTYKLKEALALVDVRLLDHFVVGKSIVSFAERGLM